MTLDLYWQNYCDRHKWMIVDSIEKGIKKGY
jgi:hypothetical protein